MMLILYNVCTGDTKNNICICDLCLHLDVVYIEVIRDDLLLVGILLSVFS